MFFRESFWSEHTNSTFVEGEFVKRERFAKTLEVVANEGGDALYGGTLTKGFINDIIQHDGILTIEDMENYE